MARQGGEKCRRRDACPQVLDGGLPVPGDLWRTPVLWGGRMSVFPSICAASGFQILPSLLFRCLLARPDCSSHHDVVFDIGFHRRLPLSRGSLTVCTARRQGERCKTTGLDGEPHPRMSTTCVCVCRLVGEAPSVPCRCGWRSRGLAGKVKTLVLSRVRISVSATTNMRPEVLF